MQSNSEFFISEQPRKSPPRKEPPDHPPARKDPPPDAPPRREPEEEHEPVKLGMWNWKRNER